MQTGETLYYVEFLSGAAQLLESVQNSNTQHTAQFLDYPLVNERFEEYFFVQIKSSALTVLLKKNVRSICRTKLMFFHTMHNENITF